VNPVKVEGDAFRRAVETALAERGYADPLWLETTEDDAGVGMARPGT